MDKLMQILSDSGHARDKQSLRADIQNAGLDPDNLSNGDIAKLSRQLMSKGELSVPSESLPVSTITRPKPKKTSGSKSGKQAVADLVTSQDALLVEASDRIQERTREKVASKLDSAVERVSDVLATSQMEVLDGLENFMLNQFGSQAVLAIAQGAVDQILDGEVVE